MASGAALCRRCGGARGRRGALVVLALATALVAMVAMADAQQSARFIRPQDLDRILANDRLLNTYIKCLLDQAPCNQDGRELRKTVPQALSTGCAQCTANQKQLTERVIRHLMAKRPRDWASLTAKYDPKGEYNARYGGSTSTTTVASKKKKQSAPKPTGSTAPASTTRSPSTTSAPPLTKA